MLPDDYFTYRNKYINKLTHFESMWDRHFRSIKAMQQQIALEKMDDRPIHPSHTTQG